ncbi:MAG: hypothetical protein QGH59_00790 [Gemmatimonadota bacterium]|jgi:hypothetical protein|nr:hypothetical protein [Gemmatimonadota bacterium]
MTRRGILAVLALVVLFTAGWSSRVERGGKYRRILHYTISAESSSMVYFPGATDTTTTTYVGKIARSIEILSDAAGAQVDTVWIYGATTPDALPLWAPLVTNNIEAGSFSMHGLADGIDSLKIATGATYATDFHILISD